MVGLQLTMLLDHMLRSAVIQLDTYIHPMMQTQP